MKSELIGMIEKKERLLPKGIIGLYGPSCVGKSYLMDQLLSIGYSRPVAFTSRPLRDEEDEKLTQKSKEEMLEMMVQGNLFLPTVFGDNIYGYPTESIKRPCVVEFTLSEVGQVKRLGGLEIAILPYSFEQLYEQIRNKRGENMTQRLNEAYIYEANVHELGLVFINDFLEGRTLKRWFSFLSDQLAITSNLKNY